MCAGGLGKAAAGGKCKSDERIGVQTIVVVGKGRVDGVVEVTDRKSGQRTDVPVADVVAHLHDF